MTISSIRLILNRIETARPESPIAVFRPKRPNNRQLLESCFANTVLTQRRINQFDPDFIGVFDRNAKLDEVRELLRFYV